MSSQRTWERRTLAGLLENARTEGLNLIEGLTVKEDGTFVFMHEELTESEAARVVRSAEALRARLEGLFARLGGGTARADEEDGVEADEADGITAGGGLFDAVSADPEPGAAGTGTLPEAGGGAADDEDTDSGAAVLSEAEYMPAGEDSSYLREPVGAGV